MTYLEKLESLGKTIGNTDLLKIQLKYKGETKTVFVKEEYQNPSGSIKIRPAFQILYDAIKEGKLVEGQRVLEVTSGNMGIALAYLCEKIGNPVTILMPKTMSQERIDMLKKYHADVVLTEDFLDGFNKQKQYEENGAFLTKQFDNLSNTKSHKKTALEIIEKTNDFDCFVSGVGTGGTLIGVGGFLKENYDKKIVVIDPKESSLLQFGKSMGSHKIQGLSDQIIPSLYKKELVDEIVEISSDDAIVMARKCHEKFGIGVGISSGANLLGAVLSKYQKIATVFADNNEKYLSTDLYNPEITSKLVDEIEFISCEKVN